MDPMNGLVDYPARERTQELGPACEAVTPPSTLNLWCLGVGCLACVSVSTMCVLPVEARGGHWILWSWSFRRPSE